MSYKTIYYSANQISGNPARYLVDSGNIFSFGDVTGWRLTLPGTEDDSGKFHVDITKGDERPLLVEYTTDDGDTWNNYLVDIGRPDTVLLPIMDEKDWVYFSSYDPVSKDPDGYVAFIASNFPVTEGRKFITDDPSIYSDQNFEYVAPLCIEGGTPIRANNWWVQARDIKPGDELGQNWARVLSVIHTAVSQKEAALHKGSRLVSFGPGSLNGFVPVDSNWQDIKLSRQHRVQVNAKAALALAEILGIKDKESLRLLADGGALIPAKDFVGLRGIRYARPRNYVLVSILCGVANTEGGIEGSHEILQTPVGKVESAYVADGPEDRGGMRPAGLFLRGKKVRKALKKIQDAGVPFQS